MNPAEFVTSVADVGAYASAHYVPSFLENPLQFLQTVTVGSLVGSVLLLADPIG